MKKQLFFLLAIGIVNGVFADDLKDNSKSCSEQNGDAFVIQFTGDASECDKLSGKGIPHTHHINGRYFSAWIKYPTDKREDDEVMNNVSVVERMKDGSFGDRRKLNTFNRVILENCYHVIEPYKSFEQSDKTFFNDHPWKKYDAEHQRFMEELKSNNCVVCKHGPEKTIIMNPQDLPENVCNDFKLKIKKEMKKRARYNAHRSWRQAEKEKKAQK